MGIPKYYNWIKDRYPNSVKKINNTELPEIDNLYIDMNGLIHQSCRSASKYNSKDPQRMEESMFINIFSYIEFCVREVRPKNTLFLAVDGVAPRNKMNEQRARRFGNAKMAARKEREAIERFENNGKTLKEIAEEKEGKKEDDKNEDEAEESEEELREDEKEQIKMNAEADKKALTEYEKLRAGALPDKNSAEYLDRRMGYSVKYDEFNPARDRYHPDKTKYRDFKKKLNNIDERPLIFEYMPSMTRENTNLNQMHIPGTHHKPKATTKYTADITFNKNKNSRLNFDSNHITPGTEFMSKMDKEIRDYINKRMKTGSHWAKLRVIYSGVQTPGEGEHKIADYIRWIRAGGEFVTKSHNHHDHHSKLGTAVDFRDDRQVKDEIQSVSYKGGIKHCIYGLDADLIHIAMSSHEKEMILLREEEICRTNYNKNVDPMRKTTRNQNIKYSTFYQVDIHQLKQEILYKDYDTMLKSPIIDTKPDNFCKTSLLDDWVFLNFVVGNDFIPETPKTINLLANPPIHSNFKPHSVPDIVPFHWAAVRATEENIIQDGVLNLKSFKQFLVAFCDQHYSLEALMKNNTTSNNKNQKSQNQILQEFDKLKLNYYKSKWNKLEWEVVINNEKRTDWSHLETICLDYIKNLNWIANYYFNGVRNSGWSYFYPHYYCPFLCDVLRFLEGFEDDYSSIKRQLKFIEDEPVLPLEQLMLVMPPRSSRCMPERMSLTMLDEKVGLHKYYPLGEDFVPKTLDFLDLTELREKTKMMFKLLHIRDKKRNNFQAASIYTNEPFDSSFLPNFSARVRNVNADRPYTALTCNCHYYLLHHDLHRIPASKIIRGVLGCEPPLKRKIEYDNRIRYNRDEAKRLKLAYDGPLNDPSGNLKKLKEFKNRTDISNQQSTSKYTSDFSSTSKMAGLDDEEEIPFEDPREHHDEWGLRLKDEKEDDKETQVTTDGAWVITAPKTYDTHRYNRTSRGKKEANEEIRNTLRKLMKEQGHKYRIEGTKFDVGMIGNGPNQVPLESIMNPRQMASFPQRRKNQSEAQFENEKKNFMKLLMDESIEKIKTEAKSKALNRTMKKTRNRGLKIKNVPSLIEVNTFIENALENSREDKSCGVTEQSIPALLNQKGFIKNYFLDDLKVPPSDFFRPPHNPNAAPVRNYTVIVECTLPQTSEDLSAEGVAYNRKAAKQNANKSLLKKIREKCAEQSIK